MGGARLGIFSSPRAYVGGKKDLGISVSPKASIEGAKSRAYISERSKSPFRGKNSKLF